MPQIGSKIQKTTKQVETDRKSSATRRRGEDLKAAIYAATIEILESEGYEAVTFQSVAKQAHTNRSVIYRYWETPFDLIFAASRYAAQQHEGYHGTVLNHTFNSGNLRKDLTDMMCFMRDNIAYFPKNFLPYIFFEMSQGRDLLRMNNDEMPDIAHNNDIIIERILARAQERGEAREDIAEDAKLLPFQMQRYHLMAENKIMTDQEIENFVDHVLLRIYLQTNKENFQKEE